MSLVIDASVIAAVFLNERDAPAAAALLRDADRLVAPDLLTLEVSSALGRRVRRGQLLAADAKKAFDSLPAAAIRLVPHRPLLAAAFALSLSLRHAIHACLYLALAQAEGVGLATLDRHMATHAAGLGIPLWNPEAA